jgi:WXXGXW repeat (2 copies)
MRKFRFLRLTLLALLICLIPASSFAGVFISVAIAPPVLPVYVQPPCPEAGLMWTPGYWAYSYDTGGYYWVPGTWVPAAYPGALWTPPYWGWSGGVFLFHPGYWGLHVGYYGGVNYGFGYMGVGFAGGMWAGGVFRYNTAVMNVGGGIHNTYRDTTIVNNTTIINNNHVAYSGGPGGVNHPPTAQENQYSHEQHTAPTSYQTQHQNTAMHDTNSYASHNGGHPTNAAVARPLGNGGGHGQQGTNNNAPRSNTAGTESHNGTHTPSNPQSQNHTSNSQPQNHTSNPAPHNTSGGSHNPPAPQTHTQGGGGGSHNPPPKNEGGGGKEHGH